MSRSNPAKATIVMTDRCEQCDDTGWVCEGHKDRPWDGVSTRNDACGCGSGIACKCNPGGSIERCLIEVICGDVGERYPGGGGIGD